MPTLGKISPCLGFENRAKEAAEFYISVFPNSKITKVNYFPAGSPFPALEGKVLGVSFELDGQEFLALNGYDPMFNFTYGMSLMVPCKDQAEIDYYTEKLMEGGGRQEDCGWVRDRFGLSWQIIPAFIHDMMKDPDPERTSKVFLEVWKMKKLDMAKIEQTYKDAGGKL